MAITVATVLVGIGTFSIDGTDVGATSNGVSATKQLDVFEKEVDQFLAVLALVVTKVGIKVKTQIAESSQSNFLIAWNEKNAPAVNVLKLGVNTVSPEHTLSFQGRSPIGGYRTFACFKAGVSGSSNYEIKKNAQAGLPVEFILLPDLTKAEGMEFGTITDA